MLEVTFRPIDRWPGEGGDLPRVRSPFSAPWSRTLEQLDLELRHLDAEHVVIQLALREDQIRLDGWPRSGAYPEHPGVVLAFDSRYGSLKYATDRFTSYQDNLRAIALGLESLRRVDRYGITKRGEQYTGWKALGAGVPADDAATFSSRDDARHFLGMAGHTFSSEQVDAGEVSDTELVRAALKRAHPDKGGNPSLFRDVQAARAYLEGA